MDRYIEFVTNHWMLFTALGVVTFLLLQDLIGSALSRFESVSPLGAVTQMNNADTVVIDVSEINEYQKGHIKEAINAPFGKFDENSQKLLQYKDSPVIVVCQTGMRSTPACKKLTQMGFEQIYNLTGGMQSWKENNLPFETTKNK